MADFTYVLLECALKYGWTWLQQPFLKIWLCLSGSGVPIQFPNLKMHLILSSKKKEIKCAEPVITKLNIVRSRCLYTCTAFDIVMVKNINVHFMQHYAIHGNINDTERGTMPYARIQTQYIFVPIYTAIWQANLSATINILYANASWYA